MIYTSGLRPTFQDYVEHTFTVEASYTPSPTVVPTEEPYVEMECIANVADCGCEDIDHEDYLGTISTTENGYTCQAWNVQTPWSHTYTPENYPEGGLENNNYCRSPDGETPWCFTTDPEVEWDYCRVPDCPTQVKVVTESPTKMPTLKPILPPDQTGTPTTPNPTNAPSKSPTVSPSASPSVSRYIQCGESRDAKDTVPKSLIIQSRYPLILFFASLYTDITNSVSHAAANPQTNS